MQKRQSKTITSTTISQPEQQPSESSHPLHPQESSSGAQVMTVEGDSTIMTTSAVKVDAPSSNPPKKANSLPSFNGGTISSDKQQRTLLRSYAVFQDDAAIDGDDRQSPINNRTEQSDNTNQTTTGSTTSVSKGMSRLTISGKSTSSEGQPKSRSGHHQHHHHHRRQPLAHLKTNSSSLGSNDSSISPVLSRDSSTDQTYTDNTGTDLKEFLTETLKNATSRNRHFLLDLEKDVTRLVMDEERMSFKFPPHGPYNRMLIHRVAAFYGLDHNVDKKDAETVIVNKTKYTRIPDFRFGDIPHVGGQSDRHHHKHKKHGPHGPQGNILTPSVTCDSAIVVDAPEEGDDPGTITFGDPLQTLPTESTTSVSVVEPKKLLRRNGHQTEGIEGKKSQSLDNKSPDRRTGLSSAVDQDNLSTMDNGRRSKSYEERTVNYEQTRARIFNATTSQVSSSNTSGIDVSIQPTSTISATANSSLRSSQDDADDMVRMSSLESESSSGGGARLQRQPRTEFLHPEHGYQSGPRHGRNKHGVIKASSFGGTTESPGTSTVQQSSAATMSNASGGRPTLGPVKSNSLNLPVSGSRMSSGSPSPSRESTATGYPFYQSYQPQPYRGGKSRGHSPRFKGYQQQAPVNYLQSDPNVCDSIPGSSPTHGQSLLPKPPPPTNLVHQSSAPQPSTSPGSGGYNPSSGSQPNKATSYHHPQPWQSRSWQHQSSPGDYYQPTGYSKPRHQRGSTGPHTHGGGPSSYSPQMPLPLPVPQHPPPQQFMPGTGYLPSGTTLITPTGQAYWQPAPGPSPPTMSIPTSTIQYYFTSGDLTGQQPQTIHGDPMSTGQMIVHPVGPDPSTFMYYPPYGIPTMYQPPSLPQDVQMAASKADTHRNTSSGSSVGSGGHQGQQQQPPQLPSTYFVGPGGTPYVLVPQQQSTQPVPSASRPTYPSQQQQSPNQQPVTTTSTGGLLPLPSYATYSTAMPYAPSPYAPTGLPLCTMNPHAISPDSTNPQQPAVVSMMGPSQYNLVGLPPPTGPPPQHQQQSMMYQQQPQPFVPQSTVAGTNSSSQQTMTGGRPRGVGGGRTNGANITNNNRPS